MATQARSPQYPTFALSRAIELVRKVHAKVHTHKAPPLVLAQAMGYGSLNGKSLQALAALKRYDLLEEVGKEFKVSRTALTILFEPANTSAWKAAMKHAATSPTLFARLCAEYPGNIPSDELVRSYLLQNGFLVSTVDIPMKSFRETMALVKDIGEDYNGVKKSDTPNGERISVIPPPPPRVGDGADIEVGDLVQWESGGVLRMEAPRIVRAVQDGWAFVEGSETGIPMEELLLEKKGAGSGGQPLAPPPRMPLPSPEIAAAPGEKELLRGTISKAQGITYRLMVTGELGSREIGKLIKLLEAQKLVLDEEDEPLA